MARQNYKNGYYIGDVNDLDERHGKGTYCWDSGARYEGDWYHNDMHGQGTYYYNDGSVYRGDFNHDNREGFAVFTYSDGTRYEGEYRNNKRTGKGTYYYASGARYVGDFVDGNFEGRGNYYWTSGDWYEGEWHNDERNGLGTYHYADGSWVYGEFADSKLVRRIRSSEDASGGNSSSNSNRGSSGNSGNSGSRSTSSQSTQTSGKIRTETYDNGTYTGEFSDNGKRHGKGIYRFNSGASFEGNFVNGVRNGHGVYRYADGDKYVGDFVDSNFEGYGKYYWHDGDWFEGEYRKDKRNGLGVYHYADGSWRFNEYRDGEVVRTFLDSDDIEKAVSANIMDEITFNDGVYVGQHREEVQKSGLFGTKKETHYVADGFGKFNCGDGSRYSGNFRDNEQCGYGLYENKKMRLYGNFRGGKVSGVALMIVGDDAYVGELNEHVEFHGHGCLYMGDGDWYDGEWANDKRNGRGTAHFGNGEWAVAEFRNGEIVDVIKRS